VREQVGRLAATPQFADAWDRSVRVAHEELVAALSGDESALTARDSTVNLDLAVFIDVARQQLLDAGFDAAGLIPEINPKIPVVEERTVSRARTGYRLLAAAATWLPWLTLAALASGVYLARGRRAALAKAALGVATAMLVLAAGVVTRGLRRLMTLSLA
jgi:hypothetical protein